MYESMDWKSTLIAFVQKKGKGVMHICKGVYGSLRSQRLMAISRYLGYLDRIYSSSLLRQF